MKRTIFLVFMILFLITSTGFMQSKDQSIKFHKIEITASSINLVKFNIADTSNTAFVQETIDGNGRTKELKFYNSRHQSTYTGSGFYGGPIIRYNYSNNTIVETFYSDENQIANDFKTSEVPYRFIYHLDDAKNIKSIEKKYIMEFEWTLESLNETVKHLEVYKKYAFEGSELKDVFGYNYAVGKLNGISPMKK
ncbi:hypothetical protein [Aquimarina spongiae]|uniref:Uncharacterized protein n=1 Tax=Aquimarina spongiae TaxID=570521 RepID=A0A1M6A2G2_9FLAO|nr:hypothetical protein [Aquimarina spongiae]SHI30650.1 hypothetical protein SAMN04488508_10138 [Aquimarina spongiae]